jgi:LPXTG-motif cell wall-anchored protein
MIYEAFRRASIGFCAIILAFTVSAGIAAAQPTTTQSSAKTGAATTTSQMEGTVLAVDGNNVIVKMSTGEIRHIVASESQRALIDGKQVAARDLQVGTKLKATVTTTKTSVMDRTVTVGTGKVFYVAPPSVILTLPNGENRQYTVKDDYRFVVEGKPATVFDLRKGMRVSAEKIVEEPRIVLTANTVVTGELPPPIKTVSSPVPQAAPVSKPAPAPVRAAAPVPARAAEPAPAPAAPAELPKTGSPLPLIGLAGALLTAFSLSLRALRRKL